MLLLAAMLLLLLWPQVALAQRGRGDLNCSDFPNQAAAQAHRYSPSAWWIIARPIV